MEMSHIIQNKSLSVKTRLKLKFAFQYIKSYINKRKIIENER